MAGRTVALHAEGYRAVYVTRGAVEGRPTSGGAMRRTHLLRGVASVGDTAVLVTGAISQADCERIDREFGVRTFRVECDRTSASRVRRLWRMVTAFADVSDLDPRVRRAVQEQARRNFPTSTKVLRIEEFGLLRGIGSGPTIVDMDDLASQIFVQRRSLQWREAGRVPLGGPYRRLPSWIGPGVVFIRRTPSLLVSDLRLRWQATRWRRAEQRAIDEADVVLFSNELDYAACGSPANGRIVPNGFTLRRREAPPARPKPESTGPTIAFWGAMSYGPNADGARWLINDVLPLLRQRITNPRLMIIGRGSAELFTSVPSDVVVKGFVEDLQQALAHVDCAVVPLRMGAGTRIKILEAWAYGLPVVSTSLGAYGLASGLYDGVVLADGTVDLATAIARVVSDDQLRQHLRVAGRRRLEPFSWQRSEAAVEDIVRSLSGTRPSDL